MEFQYEGKTQTIFASLGKWEASRVIEVIEEEIRKEQNPDS